MRDELRLSLEQQARDAYRLELAHSPLGATSAAGRDSSAPDRNCPDCGGLGWYSLDLNDREDPRFGKFFPCECTAPVRAARLQSISGLTPSERQLTLDDIVPTGGQTDLIVEIARKFVDRPSRIITLWGGSGNAKSLILQAVVNECVRQRRAAVYVEMKDLTDRVRQAHGQPAHEADDLLKRFKEVPILAIDEFDKLKVTEWYFEFETAIMRYRYRTALDGLSGTLIALNSDPALLPEHIYSRLSDGRNLILHNTDEDLRPLMAPVGE